MAMGNKHGQMDRCKLYRVLLDMKDNGSKISAEVKGGLYMLTEISMMEIGKMT